MTKYLVLLTVVSALFGGCANNKPRVVRMSDIPGTILPSSHAESVRYAENIKTYPVSRYVDPNNPRIMHEGHPIYRVESTAKWNLRPSKPLSVPSGPAAKVIDSAASRSFARDELYLELGRQKQVTQTLLQGASAVSAHLNQLGERLQATQAMSEGFLHLQEEVNTTQRRIDAFEEELRKKEASLPTSPGTEN